MINKNFSICVLVILFFSLGMTLSYYNVRKSVLTNSVLINSDLSENKYKVESIYNVDIKLSNKIPKSKSGYVIEERLFGIEDLDKIKKLFSMNGIFREIGSKYILENENQSLLIEQNNGLVKYENNIADYKINKTDSVVSEYIINETEKFFNDFNGFDGKANETIGNFEIILNEESDLFRVTSKIIMNDVACPILINKLIYNKYGDLLSGELYLGKFKESFEIKIISEKDAYYKLPSDTEGKINIDNCLLVYIYEGSILQPAYYFSGTRDNGGKFESIVIAGRF